MSEKKLFPAELRVLLLAGTVGVMVTAGWLAAMAALMTAQGYSGAAAPPLATAAVGAGSLCSGWIAAFCKRNAACCAGLYRACFMRYCSWCSAFLPVRLRKSRRCCGLLC